MFGSSCSSKAESKDASIEEHAGMQSITTAFSKFKPWPFWVMLLPTMKSQDS